MVSPLTDFLNRFLPSSKRLSQAPDQQPQLVFQVDHCLHRLIPQGIREGAIEDAISLVEVLLESLLQLYSRDCCHAADQLLLVEALGESAFLLPCWDVDSSSLKVSSSTRGWEVDPTTWGLQACQRHDNTAFELGSVTAQVQPLLQTGWYALAGAAIVSVLMHKYCSLLQPTTSSTIGSTESPLPLTEPLASMLYRHVDLTSRALLCLQRAQAIVLSLRDGQAVAHRTRSSCKLPSPPSQRPAGWQEEGQEDYDDKYDGDDYWDSRPAVAQLKRAIKNHMSNLDAALGDAVMAHVCTRLDKASQLLPSEGDSQGLQEQELDLGALYHGRAGTDWSLSITLLMAWQLAKRYSLANPVQLSKDTTDRSVVWRVSKMVHLMPILNSILTCVRRRRPASRGR